MIHVNFGIPNEENHSLTFETLSEAREKVTKWLETKTFYLQVEKEEQSGCRLLKLDNGTWEVRVASWEKGGVNTLERVFTSTNRTKVFEVMHIYLSDPGHFSAMGHILKLHEERKQQKGTFTERHKKRYAEKQRIENQKTWISFIISILIFAILSIFFYRQVMTL